jgi:hypothetical protein
VTTNPILGATTKGNALALHILMLPPCSEDEGCLEGERLHDEWFDQVVKVTLETASSRQGASMAS